jgi:hypothetical protein
VRPLKRSYIHSSGEAVHPVEVRGEGTEAEAVSESQKLSQSERIAAGRRGLCARLPHVLGVMRSMRGGTGRNGGDVLSLAYAAEWYPRE